MVEKMDFCIDDYLLVVFSFLNRERGMRNSKELI